MPVRTNFFVGLLIEYQYGLFPPGKGTLYVINQCMFYVAMSCILVMLWGMRAVKAGNNGRSINQQQLDQFFYKDFYGSKNPSYAFGQ
jgi:hypothetical protein